MAVNLFERNGRIVMEELLMTSTSYTWADIITTKTSDAWLEDLTAFIPAEVTAAFGKDRLPTATEVRSLPFHGNEAGACADVLTADTGLGKPVYYMYPGMCSHRPVHLRRLDHESPSALKKYPDSLYYQLKHGDNSHKLSSRFVAFARIPTDDARLEKSTVGHRRMLCRLAEAFFTVWTMSSDTSHRLAGDLADASRRAIMRAYGNPSDVEWNGLATHSPLKEQIGRDDRRTVAKGRYEEAMDRLALLYGGASFVPDDMEALAKRHSTTDQLNQRRLRDDREKRKEVEYPDGVRAAKVQRAEETKTRRAGQTAGQKEDTAEYHRAYYVNREVAMTPVEKADDALDKAASTRKHRISKAFDAGILTQAQVDAAKAKDWYAQPGWPKAWSRAPSKKAQRGTKTTSGVASHSTLTDNTSGSGSKTPVTTSGSTTIAKKTVRATVTAKAEVLASAAKVATASKTAVSRDAMSNLPAARGNSSGASASMVSANMSAQKSITNWFNQSSKSREGLRLMTER